MKKICFGILIIISLIINSCYISQPVVEDSTGVYRFNFSALYNPAESAIHPQCFLYHNTDINTIVFFRQQLDELHSLNNNSIDNSFRYGARYILRESDSFNVADSATTLFKINKDSIKHDFITFFNVKTEMDKKYVLIVILFCRDTKAHKRFLFEIDKTNPFDTENFFVEEISITKTPKFDNFVRSDLKYSIDWNRFNKDQIAVKYYKLIKTMPEPPYSSPSASTLPLTPDSVFVYKKGDSIVFNKKGLYYFQAESDNNSGLVMLNSGKYFPYVNTVYEMLEPLRYISGGREYSKLADSENKKKDMDDFWLSKSNNRKTATEQIRIYYNRVQLANKYFSDYRQGFRTDRGMIYIIFGAPAIVRLMPSGEEWFYGENPEVSSLNFLFEKHNNPISKTEYKLIRGPQYQNIWGQAISTWRSGRIFLTNK
jgi:GWxTD domain-containing protein